MDDFRFFGQVLNNSSSLTLRMTRESSRVAGEKPLCNCNALRMSECCRSDTFLKGNGKTVDFERLNSLVYLYKKGRNE